MQNNCNLSIVTTQYLDTFRQILERMICGMTNARLTNSISRNFIVQMIPHHEAAIEMSRNLLKYTTDIPLQNIALQIIEEQTKSIANMRRVESRCSDCINSDSCLSAYQCRINQIKQVMFRAMQNARTGNDINQNFMHEMIPHHRGAVEMSETTLSYDICPELRPILQAIIVSQKRGIRQMQELLRRDNNCPG